MSSKAHSTCNYAADYLLSPEFGSCHALRVLIIIALNRRHGRRLVLIIGRTSPKYFTLFWVQNLSHSNICFRHFGIIGSSGAKVMRTPDVEVSGDMCRLDSV